MRLKPRYNAEVNEWWMCDEGRFGFSWIDRGRLKKVRHQGADSTWEQAMTAITAALANLRPNGAGPRLGVIASPQLTNEDLFLIREIFQAGLGAQVTASVPTTSGYSDDFLIKADKNPNTLGTTLLGLAGPGALDAADLVAAALQGHIEALWVFGYDLTKLSGEKLIIDEATIQELSRKLRLFVFSGTNENPTASLAHWVLPTAASVEKDGTFVNCHGRLQRIGRVFPPLSDSREDWNVLLDVARELNHPLPLAWRNPKEIFLGLARTVAPFEGLTYEKIGPQGAQLTL
jgi:NADH-quinone oxidoreductase subunit G